MQKKLIEILKLLESAVPPPKSCHHLLMYAQFGSDETGWEDRLLLQVNKDGKFYPFFWDEDDLQHPSTEIVAAIVDLLSQPAPKNWQVSKIGGQAGPVQISGELRI